MPGRTGRRCRLVLADRQARCGTAAALLGCLGLIVTPRERMAAPPWRLRALPRRHDAAQVLATLLSSPGYSLNWFTEPTPMTKPCTC
jgi:hypothetical protein